MITTDPEDFTIDVCSGTATHKSGAVVHFDEHHELWATNRSDQFPGPIESLEYAATIAMNRALGMAV